MNDMNMNQMMNNMFNMNNMIQNMNIDPNQMEIINHLMNQNKFMQNQIEMNNMLIQKIIQNNLLKNNNNNFQGIKHNIFQNNNLNNPNDFFPGYVGKRTNVSFETGAGKKNIAAPYNIPICQLLSTYLKNLGLSDDLIDKKIFFIWNGRRLNKDNIKTLLELGFQPIERIVVIEA